MDSKKETIDIKRHMEDAYLTYSLSVIVDRALPSVHDGLKPVHRRILYAMYDLGITKKSAYKKSARVVGDVIGKYHPHGDTSVYDAMVGMAQDFTMSIPLVDGQGNFGSIDGDNPAAMRYTEVRPEGIVETFFADIEYRTVSFIPNYDDSELEPKVLPVQYPNLLVNGGNGIAVGMSTVIPPHNIVEVCVTAKKFLFGKIPTWENIFKDFHGPDFPTGGIIFGKKGILDYAKTGQGSIKIRAKTAFEKIKRHDAIIITELPYAVNKAKLVSHIADLGNSKDIKGIKTVRDESDRHGIRIVVELKGDLPKEIILNNLFQKTALETTFSTKFRAILKDEPKIFNLIEYFTEFVNFRRSVIIKRSIEFIRVAKDRLEKTIGLIKATSMIDKIIKLIKASKTTEIAKATLMTKMKFTPVQCDVILSMQLKRLTGLEAEKLKQRKKELEEEIKYHESVISSTENIDRVIEEELNEIISRTLHRTRKTQIEENYIERSVEDIIPNIPVLVSITYKGYVKRMDINSFRQQSRNGKGSKAVKVDDDDFVSDFFTANSHDTLIILTEDGRVYSLKVYTIPEASKTAKGRAIVNLITTSSKPKVFIPVSSFSETNSFVIITKKGIIKKTSLKEYETLRTNGANDIKIGDGDQILNAFVATLKDKHVIAFTKEGKALKCKINTFRHLSRNTRGVTFMRTHPGDELVGAVPVSDGNDRIFIVTENGIGKVLCSADFRAQGNGGYGVIAITLNKKTGKVVTTVKVSENDDVMLLTRSGLTVRIPVGQISKLSRQAMGVRVIKLSKDDTVVAASKTPKKEKENE